MVCAIGLGSVAGIGRAFDIAAIRRRPGLHLVVLGALVAIVFADLSMLSKAETERIWLPFTIWLTAAAALLPPRSQRWWLAVNVVGALLLNQPDPDELVDGVSSPWRAACRDTGTRSESVGVRLQAGRRALALGQEGKAVVDDVVGEDAAVRDTSRASTG